MRIEHRPLKDPRWCSMRSQALGYRAGHVWNTKITVRGKTTVHCSWCSQTRTP